MTLTDFGTLFLTGVAGVLLGGIFFGGLWWTVRNGLTSKQPGLWFLGSLVARTTVVLVGFFYASGGRWQQLLSCLIGFLAARAIVIRLSRVIPVPAGCSSPPSGQRLSLPVMPQHSTQRD
jgi:F1F0 ATPase subunit 2